MISGPVREFNPDLHGGSLLILKVAPFGILRDADLLPKALGGSP